MGICSYHRYVRMLVLGSCNNLHCYHFLGVRFIRSLDDEESCCPRHVPHAGKEVVKMATELLKSEASQMLMMQKEQAMQKR